LVGSPPDLLELALAELSSLSTSTLFTLASRLAAVSNAQLLDAWVNSERRPAEIIAGIVELLPLLGEGRREEAVQSALSSDMGDETAKSPLSHRFRCKTRWLRRLIASAAGCVHRRGTGLSAMFSGVSQRQCVALRQRFSLRLGQERHGDQPKNVEQADNRCRFAVAAEADDQGAGDQRGDRGDQSRRIEDETCGPVQPPSPSERAVRDRQQPAKKKPRRVTIAGLSEEQVNGALHST
jgi:hypothetical protein